MLSRYHYTEKEKEQIFKSMVMLVDTREKVASHITDWFDKHKIAWKSKALSNGDYSFMVQAIPELNIDRDIYFDKDIMVERKRNLDEIASNFTTYRSRFESEMATFHGKKYILLESSTYGDIIDGRFQNKVSVKSFLGTLHTFSHRYNIEVVYMPDNKYSAAWIYGTMLYYLKNILK